MDALFRCGKKGISTSRGVQVDKSTNYLVVEEIPNSLATSALARSTRALALDIHSLIVFPGTLEAINLLNTPEDGILPTFSAIHCRWIGSKPHQVLVAVPMSNSHSFSFLWLCTNDMCKLFAENSGRFIRNTILLPIRLFVILEM